MLNGMLLIFAGLILLVLACSALCVPALNAASLSSNVGSKEWWYMHHPRNSVFDGGTVWTPLHSSLKNAKLNWYLFRYCNYGVIQLFDIQFGWSGSLLKEQYYEYYQRTYG